MAWLFVLATACSVENVDSASGSVVLGENDLLTVSPSGTNVPMKYLGLLDAIGRSVPAKCTVTHVGNGVAITAGHCFRDPQGRADNLPCTSKLGSTMTIEWGVRGDLDAEPYLVSSCRILALAFDNEGADYAILAVDPVPPRVARVAFERPAHGQPLTIFSHPQGRPLEWSRTCPRGDDRFAEVFKHSCDTEGGSSGAGVLDDARVAIVGIHNGGSPGEYNYATYLADTPLAEFLGGGQPPSPSSPRPPPPPPSDTFANLEAFSETIVAGQWFEVGPYNISSKLRVTMTGDGDVDLHVRRGAKPTPTAFECRPYLVGSNESCDVEGPAQVWLAFSGDAPTSDILVEVSYE